MPKTRFASFVTEATLLGSTVRVLWERSGGRLTIEGFTQDHDPDGKFEQLLHLLGIDTCPFCGGYFGPQDTARPPALAIPPDAPRAAAEVVAAEKVPPPNEAKALPLFVQLNDEINRIGKFTQETADALRTRVSLLVGQGRLNDAEYLSLDQAIAARMSLFDLARSNGALQSPTYEHAAAPAALPETPSPDAQKQGKSRSSSKKKAEAGVAPAAAEKTPPAAVDDPLLDVAERPALPPPPGTPTQTSGWICAGSRERCLAAGHPDCATCSLRDCPHGGVLHYHPDGCPHCNPSSPLAMVPGPAFEHMYFDPFDLETFDVAFVEGEKLVPFLEDHGRKLLCLAPRSYGYLLNSDGQIRRDKMAPERLAVRAERLKVIEAWMLRHYSAEEIARGRELYDPRGFQFEDILKPMPPRAVPPPPPPPPAPEPPPDPNEPLLLAGHSVPRLVLKAANLRSVIEVLVKEGKLFGYEELVAACKRLESLRDSEGKPSCLGLTNVTGGWEGRLPGILQRHYPEVVLPAPAP